MSSFEIVIGSGVSNLIPSTDNLIIVGGLHPIDSDLFRSVLIRVCKKYKRVFLIPGAEEYRTQNKMSIQTIEKYMCELSDSPGLKNLKVIIDESVTLGEYEIYGSVCWPVQNIDVKLFVKGSRGPISVSHEDLRMLRSNSIAGADLAMVVAKAGKRSVILITHYGLPSDYKRGELVKEVVCGRTFDESIKFGTLAEKIEVKPGKKTVCGEMFFDFEF